MKDGEMAKRFSPSHLPLPQPIGEATLSHPSEPCRRSLRPLQRRKAIEDATPGFLCHVMCMVEVAGQRAGMSQNHPAVPGHVLVDASMTVVARRKRSRHRCARPRCAEVRPPHRRRRGRMTSSGRIVRKRAQQNARVGRLLERVTSDTVATAWHHHQLPAVHHEAAPLRFPVQQSRGRFIMRARQGRPSPACCATITPRPPPRPHAMGKRITLRAVHPSK